MNTPDAMRMGKESILSVINELTSRCNTHWDDMIDHADDQGDDAIDNDAKEIIDSDGFKDPQCHRFAAILCLVRYLRDFAYDQHDKVMFDAAIRQVVGDGDDLSELLRKVMPAIKNTLISRQDKRDKDSEVIW